jgi:hypothetical protein
MLKKVTIPASFTNKKVYLKICFVSFRYIFSGYESVPPHFNPDVYKLDLTTLVWTLVNCSGSPPLPRDFHTATAVGDNMIIFGGRSG